MFTLRQIIVNNIGPLCSNIIRCKTKQLLSLFPTKAIHCHHYRHPTVHQWVSRSNSSDSRAGTVSFSKLFENSSGSRGPEQQINLPAFDGADNVTTNNDFNPETKLTLNFHKLIRQHDEDQFDEFENISAAVLLDTKLETCDDINEVTDEYEQQEISLTSSPLSHDTKLLDDKGEEQHTYDVDPFLDLSIGHTSSNTEYIATDTPQTDIQQQKSPPPSTTIYQYKSTEEAYFQWDYRYHPRIREVNMINILTKIDRTLHNAHLEPYGKLRGVESVRKNILNFDTNEKFRLGRNKSLEKGKVIKKSTHKGLVLDHEKTEARMKRLLRPLPLVRSILKIIYERHAIYASGYSEQIAKLDKFCLGESFFGRETHIRVDYETATLILRELWLHGHSGTFNKLQKNHNEYQERMEERNYRPKLTDD